MSTGDNADWPDPRLRIERLAGLSPVWHETEWGRISFYPGDESGVWGFSAHYVGRAASALGALDYGKDLRLAWYPDVFFPCYLYQEDASFGALVAPVGRVEDGRPPDGEQSTSALEDGCVSSRLAVWALVEWPPKLRLRADPDYAEVPA